MRCLFAMLLFALAACASAQNIDAMRLSAEGLGPVRIGMLVDDAQAVLGDAMRPSETEPDIPGCREWSLGPAIGMLSLDGRVSRISIHYNHGSTAVRTERGVGIGSTAADVRAAYPAAERASAEYTPPPGHELFAWSDRENGIGLRFEIGESEQVTAIHAGSELMNIEGCASA